MNWFHIKILMQIYSNLNTYPVFCLRYQTNVSPRELHLSLGQFSCIKNPVLEILACFKILLVNGHRNSISINSMSAFSVAVLTSSDIVQLITLII